MDEPQDKRRDEPPGRPAAGSRAASTPEVLAARPLEEPHPGRLSPDDPSYLDIIRAHTEALEAGADSYLDPRSRLTVLTAGFLARRGYCCESGCRHCPYV